mmetsp:Transcript_19626/g.38882  ORF Transcript_19626/g.38882 Transcript_19626/m.38882 type:complete len:209 (-) Transcript_19626:117-743(-)
MTPCFFRRSRELRSFSGTPSVMTTTNFRLLLLLSTRRRRRRLLFLLHLLSHPQPFSLRRLLFLLEFLPVSPNSQTSSLLLQHLSSALLHHTSTNSSADSALTQKLYNPRQPRRRRRLLFLLHLLALLQFLFLQHPSSAPLFLLHRRLRENWQTHPQTVQILLTPVALARSQRLRNTAERSTEKAPTSAGQRPSATRTSLRSSVRWYLH